MNWFYAAIAASFFLGAFATVLFTFWLRPIMAYRRLKRRVSKDVALYLDTLTGGKAGRKEAAAALRGHGDHLSQPHQAGLPDWYTLLLTRRGENPSEAGRLLATLANTSDPDHAVLTAAKIRNQLKG